MVAHDLEVSRTPVRAAIQRLIAEGLLELAPKRGAIVTEWRKTGAEEIFDLRILLEGHSASLAAQRISMEKLDYLEHLNDRIERAVREKEDNYLDVVHKANFEFHQTVFESCGSGHLRMFCASLLEFPMVIGGFYLYSEDDMAESIRQHKEIISGLRAHNPEWARAAMVCHLTAAIERFKKSRREGVQDRSSPDDEERFSDAGSAALGGVAVRG